jgi:hypothetical protein
VPEYGALAAYHDAVERNDEPWSDAELLRRVDANRLLFALGQGWSYSNVGYLYVRRIVEATTGDDLDVAPRARATRRYVHGVVHRTVRISRARGDPRLEHAAYRSSAGCACSAVPDRARHGL